MLEELSMFDWGDLCELFMYLVRDVGDCAPDNSDVAKSWTQMVGLLSKCRDIYVNLGRDQNRGGDEYEDDEDDEEADVYDEDEYQNVEPDSSGIRKKKK